MFPSMCLFANSSSLWEEGFELVPLPLSWTEASGASRSQRERQRDGAGAIPSCGLQSRFFRSCDLRMRSPVIFVFLLRQENETAAPAQGAAVLPASSFSPRTVFHQSVAQLEPQVACAPNSNRCQSVGFGRQLVFVRMSQNTIK